MESKISPDGEFMCLRCHQKCHLTGQVIDGKLEGIEGAACIKGTTIPDLVYHPDRVLYPKKRVGEKGSGKWERISWDQAIEEIAAKMNEVTDKYGSETIFLSTGSGQKQMGNQTCEIGKKFFDTPQTHWGRYTCILPEAVADFATAGETLTYEYCPEYRDSKLIVFWGANVDITCPAQALEAKAAIRAGAKLIVVDPRPTPMAKRADIWLKIRPGTDTALGLGMLNVIINEELYDKDFVENWTVGFDKLKTHVQDFTPAWAAPITDLSEEDIIAAARLYAGTHPASIYARCGSVSQQINSSQNARAIACLVGLCGNVDVPGGNILYVRTFADRFFYHTYAMRISLRTSPNKENKIYGFGKYPMMHFFSICDMPTCIRGMHDGRTRAAWIVANNLVVSDSDSRMVFEGLKKLDLVVVSEHFMTPTAEVADYVLPAASYAEIDNIVCSFQAPYNYAVGHRKAIAPLGECWDDRRMIIEVGKKMGRSEVFWEDVEDWLDWRARYSGKTFDEICNMPDHRINFPREYRRYEKDVPAFQTPSGKFELYSEVFEAFGTEPLPTFRENPESPVTTPEIFKEYPFIYMHIRLAGFQHTEGRQIKRQRRMHPDPILEMHPDPAAELGISDGDWVKLQIAEPKYKDKHISFRAKLVDTMHPKTVGADHGWWFPEKPAPEHGAFDSNINALLSMEHGPYEPTVGNIQQRAIACKVTKA